MTKHYSQARLAETLLHWSPSSVKFHSCAFISPWRGFGRSTSLLGPWSFRELCWSFTCLLRGRFRLMTQRIQVWGAQLYLMGSGTITAHPPQSSWHLPYSSSRKRLPVFSVWYSFVCYYEPCEWPAWLWVLEMFEVLVRRLGNI